MHFIARYKNKLYRMTGSFLAFCGMLLLLIYALLGRESLPMIAVLGSIYAVCSAVLLALTLLFIHNALKPLGPSELDRLCTDYEQAPKYRGVVLTDTHIVCTDFMSFRILPLWEVARVQIETPYGNRYTGKGQPMLMVQERSTGRRFQFRLPRDGYRLEELLQRLEARIGPAVYR